MANFETVAGNHPRYSSHNLSYSKKLTAKFGLLYPVLCEEVVPGDIWQMGNEVVARMAPLFSPVLADIDIYTHYFFVPYRLLWDDWEDFITGGKKGNFDEPLPIVEDAKFLAKKSFGDYLGMPLMEQFGSDVDTAGTASNVAFKDVGISIFPWSAYSLIWNKYYRDENLQLETYVKYPTGQTYTGTPDAKDTVDFKEWKGELLSRNWKKDYFTSALPWIIRGDAPMVPVVSTGQITFPSHIFGSQKARENITSKEIENSNLFPHFSGSFDFYRFRKKHEYLNYLVVKIRYFAEPSFDALTQSEKDYFISFLDEHRGKLSYLSNFDVPSLSVAEVYLQLRNYWINLREKGFLIHNSAVSTSIDVNFKSSGFNIDDLRLSAQIQKWMELNARAGTEYTTFLHAHFGVSPTDARLNRPEYIGGTKAPIILSEVLQTSGSVSGGSAQGNMAGHGLSAFSQFVGKFRAEEYGLVIGLMSIMPKGSYMSRGVNRQWTRKTRFDFYSPEFANISEQGIKRQELYASGDKEANNRIFGYQGRFDEMRVKHDMAVGLMRDDFAHWHLARALPSNVELNEDFITVKHSELNRIFSVMNEDGFFINYANNVKAIRPMPYMGTPGITSI